MTVAGYAPGTVLADLTCVIDDTAGTGATITLGAADANGVAWRITGLDGWDSPDLGENAEARTGADGAWDSDNYFAGRQITVTGLIEAPDRAVLQDAKTTLAQVVPARGRLVEFRVNEPIPKLAMVRRSGRLMISDDTDRVAEFSVNLFAPDPRKYGIDVQFAAGSLADSTTGVTPPLAIALAVPARAVAGGASFTVTNAGVYETPPLIRFAGPGKNLGLANLTTGQVLRYPFELAAGQELIVDVDAGAALLDGTAFRAPAPGSTVTSRFMLPPGDSVLQMVGTITDTSVAPLVGVSWRHAWI